MTALAIALLMLGGLLIWAGITDQSVIDELKNVFSGKKVGKGKAASGQ